MRIRDSFRLRRSPGVIPLSPSTPTPPIVLPSQPASKPQTAATTPLSATSSSSSAPGSSSPKTPTQRTPSHLTPTTARTQTTTFHPAGPLAPLTSSSSTTSTATTPQPPSPFFRLPRELRDRIYIYVLTTPTALLLPTENPSFGLSPALLRVSRQLHAEAGPLLYKLNRFTFSHPSDCAAFRALADADCAADIASVALRVKERELRLWMRYLASTDRDYAIAADLPNLRYLVVFLRQSWWVGAVDPEINLRQWLHNGKVKSLCKGLEGRLPGAEVTVVCSLRVPEEHFQAMRRGARDLVPYGECYLRSGPVACAGIDGVRCVLELLSPEASFGGGQGG